MAAQRLAGREEESAVLTRPQEEPPTELAVGKGQEAVGDRQGAEVNTAALQASSQEVSREVLGEETPTAGVAGEASLVEEVGCTLEELGEAKSSHAWPGTSSQSGEKRNQGYQRRSQRPQEVGKLAQKCHRTQLDEARQARASASTPLASAT